MVKTFTGRWNPLLEKTYIDETRKATQVIWLGRIAVLNQYVVRLVTDNDLLCLFKIIGLCTRQCSIDSYDQWNHFADSCYLVRYKNDKQWQREDAENYTLKEFASDKQNDPEFTRQGEFTGNIIISAYDTQRDKRVIIDGIHRATILTNECEKQLRIPNATIYECYGDKVDRIFSCDFCHF
ncbi:MAG: hypothetical protein HY707_09915 [Ignavibacteriae bacterium]|nr:hypothetical protein [Ignavibacteriota bacterium]